MMESRPPRDRALTPGRRRGGEHTAGYTYIGLLIAIVVMFITAGGAASLYSFERQRDRERELLFAGAQIRDAIKRYQALNVNGRQSYPKELEDLVLDRRFPFVVRHLRRLYQDPVTGTRDWALIRDAEGGIVGVHSKSSLPTIKRALFPPDLPFVGATAYTQWRFIAEKPVPVPAANPLPATRP